MENINRTFFFKIPDIIQYNYSMNIDYSFFKVSDGHSLAYKKWDKVDNPKGIIVIIHGMAEHIERYDDLASFLNNNGFVVYGTDQRGHGKTSGRRGFFAEHKGWERVILDQEEFFSFVRNSHDNLPISYIAHSMGSFIMRNLLSRNNLTINKVILSGTGFHNFIKAKFATTLASMITFFRGSSRSATFLDNMVNGPMAASIKDPITNFDWLSRDNVEVAKYVNDTNCGFICTNQFYKDFFKLITFACSRKHYKRIDKELPILLYSGENDPVGGVKASGVLQLEKLYKSEGINVSTKINPEGRHENVNETNKKEVFNQFLEFLNM